MSVKVKKRHSAWNKALTPIISTLIRRKFNYHCKKSDLKPPFIVLGNHTTDYDAFFIAKSFSTPLYFVMSDHVSSIPVVGKIIRHLLCPIPITKSTADVSTVRGVLSVLRQGAAVGIFPEGNKSFAGEMSLMKPSLSKLLKKANVPVVIYNIEGGYFSSPRWSKQKRKGKIDGYVKRVITTDEIANMPNEQLFETVKNELRVNAYEVQQNTMQKFVGKDLADNIQTLLYICPECKAISSIVGQGDTFHCTNCDFKASYNEYGYVEGYKVNRLDELDNMQKQYIQSIDYSKFDKNTVISSDTDFLVKLKVNNYKNKKLGKQRLDMYVDRFELVSKNDVVVIPFSMVSGYAIEGVNSIQLSLTDGRVYRLNNKNAVSGLKYVNIMCAITGKIIKF